MLVTLKRGIVSSFLKSTDYFEKICQKLRGIGKSKKTFVEVIIMKRRLALVLASAMLLTSAVAGLSSCKSGGNTSGADASKGHVYYLSFKPEADEAWQGLAKAYTEETGVQVDIMTAASGQYETMLSSEISKADAPTIFQVNGPNGLAKWKDFCYDLTDSDFAKELNSQDFALKDDEGKTRGIGYVLETYGIIVNKKLLEQSGHKLDEITNFETLKAVADDIHANKDKNGFDAFSTAGMESSTDWRFKTHLANLPIYLEYKAKGIDTSKTLEGTALDNFRNIWDLYITDASTDPAILSSKTMADCTAEFTEGKAVFYQNGTWAYGDLQKAGFADEDLAYIPIYTGAEGEENQGLCTGTENYMCVNSQADEKDIEASLEFLKWVFTSEKGTDVVANEMGFLSPFKRSKTPNNYLVKLANDALASGKTPVSWNFSTIPSEDWKNGVGDALATYAKNPSDDTWNGVKVAFVDGWASEYAKLG